MKTAVAHLSSLSPYGQSKYYQTPHLQREIHKDYEERTWRDRLHTTDDGYVFIPPMAFKNALSEAAKYVGRQVPGKGKSTYTKHFEAGVSVLALVAHVTKPGRVKALEGSISNQGGGSLPIGKTLEAFSATS